MAVIKYRELPNENWEKVTSIKGDPGEKGKDAIINGVNTLNIIEGKNIKLSQRDSDLIINSEAGGVFVGEKAPLEEGVNVWIDTSENSSSESILDNMIDNKINPHIQNEDIHVSPEDRVRWDNNSGGGIQEIPIATETILGGIKAPPKTSAMTQEVGIDSDGKLWTVKGDINLPIATSDILGGVKAIPKTQDMTQEVGVDSEGKLWILPAGEGKIKTVNGKGPDEKGNISLFSPEKDYNNLIIGPGEFGTCKTTSPSPTEATNAVIPTGIYFKIKYLDLPAHGQKGFSPYFIGTFHYCPDQTEFLPLNKDIFRIDIENEFEHQFLQNLHYQDYSSWPGGEMWIYKQGSNGTFSKTRLNLKISLDNTSHAIPAITIRLADNETPYTLDASKMHIIEVNYDCSYYNYRLQYRTSF